MNDSRDELGREEVDPTTYFASSNTVMASLVPANKTMILESTFFIAWIYDVTLALPAENWVRTLILVPRVLATATNLSEPIMEEMEEID